MRPIPNELRINIIEAKKRNEPTVIIKEWFNVSKKSIERIWSNFKKTGSYLPKPFPGKQSGFTEEMNNKIINKIKEKPDITQAELIDELKLSISQPGLSKHLKKLGFTLKKRLFMLQELKNPKSSRQEPNSKKNKKN
jgi:transposase